MGWREVCVVLLVFTSVRYVMNLLLFSSPLKAPNLSLCPSVMEC